MSEWITKQDVIDGIKVLMQNGKKLPYADRLKEIAAGYPEGTDIAVIKQACIKEQRRQVNELADQWFDVLVPEEKYRKTTAVMDKERWQLAIKQSLLVKDYQKILDISVVAQGIDAADKIIKKANEAIAYEAQQKANAEWRSFGDIFEEEEKYRNSILAHWTAIRLKKGILKFDFPSLKDSKLPQDILIKNYNMLMMEAKKMFPDIPDNIFAENIMLIGMQHVNKQYCQHICTGCETCYMNGRKLGLEFQDGRFVVVNDLNLCQKFISSKLKAQQADEERRRKIQEF